MPNTYSNMETSRIRAYKLIDVNAALKFSSPGWVRHGLSASLEYLLAIHKLNTLYGNLPFQLQPVDFCRKSLEVLRLHYAVTEQELALIPKSGPLVVVANHPFGGIEGIILSEILLNIRSDVRILGNYLLNQIPELRNKIISVNPFTPRKAAVKNAAAIRKSIKWIEGGRALLVFPSGEVSHWRAKSCRITDPPWNSHIAWMIIRAKAKTVPVYFHGRNSLLFNIAGLIHPGLRTLLLPREMINKHSSTIELTIGKPIQWQRLSALDSPQEATEFLRFSTYLLKHRRPHTIRPFPGRLLPSKERSRQLPIIAPVHKAYLQKEISTLTAANHLIQHKMFRIYITTAEQSPAIMREIARLREYSFRDAGEGTGQSLDSDRFDAHYQQLFLWNEETSEIVGAYRIGETGRILDQKGTQGLYTASLFDYKPAFFNHLDKALELGRSFIRPEYQRKFGCLVILWRGIGEFVARNRQFRYLFGPVSISQDYHTISRNLMVAFLQHNKMDHRLACLVAPRIMPKLNGVGHPRTDLHCIRHSDIEDLSLLISEIEQDQKGIPTLIKHYLKLNGRFLAFSVDRDFANVIDGLVWVDLFRTDPKILSRFMGDAAGETFRHYHTEMDDCCASPAEPEYRHTPPERQRAG